MPQVAGGSAFFVRPHGIFYFMSTQQTSDAEAQAVILTATLKQKQVLSKDEIAKMQELRLEIDRLIPSRQVKMNLGRTINSPI
jgi:hypothetical protein